MFLIAVEDFNILFRVSDISHRVWVERAGRVGSKSALPSERYCSLCCF